MRISNPLLYYWLLSVLLYYTPPELLVPELFLVAVRYLRAPSATGVTSHRWPSPKSSPRVLTSSCCSRAAVTTSCATGTSAQTRSTDPVSARLWRHTNTTIMLKKVDIKHGTSLHDSTLWSLQSGVHGTATRLRMRTEFPRVRSTSMLQRRGLTDRTLASTSRASPPTR